MVKFLAGALAASLIVLSGCVIHSGSTNDVFESACRNGPTAHLAFLIYADTNDVSASVIRNERDAYMTLVSVCNNPNPDKITAAIEAYAEILETRN